MRMHGRCRGFVVPGLVVLGLSFAMLGPVSALPAAPSSARSRARALYALQRDIRSLRLVRGNPGVPEIALTFDDGPHRGKTERLLDILRRAGVRATFFVVGRQVDRYPALVARELAEGHEIANHSYDHLRLPGLADAGVEREVREGDRAVVRAIGSPTRLFRPPGGEYDAEDVALLRRLGAVLVLWTDDPGDWRRPPAALLERRLLATVGNGSIILLHDGIPETLQMLPDLIARLRARGYRFVTVSEMALRGGTHVSGGPCVLPRASSAPSGKRPTRTAHPLAPRSFGAGVREETDSVPR
jgi:peptidoglycan/xylan/chitin deacetylase (PgdA/CDA1 family)